MNIIESEIIMAMFVVLLVGLIPFLTLSPVCNMILAKSTIANVAGVVNSSLSLGSLTFE